MGWHRIEFWPSEFTSSSLIPWNAVIIEADTKSEAKGHFRDIFKVVEGHPHCCTTCGPEYRLTKSSKNKILEKVHPIFFQGLVIRYYTYSPGPSLSEILRRKTILVLPKTNRSAIKKLIKENKGKVFIRNEARKLYPYTDTDKNAKKVESAMNIELKDVLKL